MTGNARVDSLIAQMTLDEKLLLIHGQYCDPYRANQAGFILGCPRLGIPPVFIADGESGINVSWEATALPAKVGLAASFDTALAQAYGEVLGEEAKATGMHVVLSPRVNIVRDYIAPVGRSNGGNYQTYSEDPLLNGLMGAAEAKGIEKDHNAIANLKQMFGSSTGAAQGAGNCVIDEQTMHEIYLRAFEIVCKSGVGSAMTNYNQVNGTWTYKYTDVTQTLCRDRWGFSGFLVDDWYCLYEPEALHGGVTLEMPGEDAYNQGSQHSWYGDRLKAAIEDPENPVTMEDVDRAVELMLCTLDRFGMLDEPRVPGPISEEVKSRSACTARLAACKSAVLLKNKGVLPISPEKERIAIIGPTAQRQPMPIFKEAAYGFTDRLRGALEVFRERYGDEVAFAVGDDLDGEVIPMKYLKSRNGTPDHISLDLVRMAYDPLGNGPIEKPCEIISSMGEVNCNNFGKSNALPVIDTPKNGDALPAYMLSGSIVAPETGWYRICLQSHIPGVDAFEKNHITSEQMAVDTSGNLYVRRHEGEWYDRIGIGTRIGMNGGAVPNSDLIPCADGYNNAAGQVYMEAGKAYDFIATCRCIYEEPVEVRLNWVTPSMRRKNEDEAVEAARSADKVLVFVWHHSPNEQLSLHENQNELIEKIAAVNSNIAVVINSGDPIGMPWLEHVDAVLEMWLSGQEGGEATVDVLTGKFNPAGRLPITFPKAIEDSATHAPCHPERSAQAGRVRTADWEPENTAHFTEGILMGYRHFDASGIEPLFPFGFGLSYTTFAYSNLDVVQSPEGGLDVSFTVTNTGDRDGEEVPQCYVSAPADRPVNVQFAPRALAAFTRIALGAGESRRVFLKVARESLCYWRVIHENNHLDEGEDWTLLPGSWTVTVGPSSREAALSTQVHVKA